MKPSLLCSAKVVGYEIEQHVLLSSHTTSIYETSVVNCAIFVSLPTASSLPSCAKSHAPAFIGAQPLLSYSLSYFLHSSICSLYSNAISAAKGSKWHFYSTTLHQICLQIAWASYSMLFAFSAIKFQRCFCRYNRVLHVNFLSIATRRCVNDVEFIQAPIFCHSEKHFGTFAFVCILIANISHAIEAQVIIQTLFVADLHQTGCCYFIIGDCCKGWE